jgi:hypothetical protein
MLAKFMNLTTKLEYFITYNYTAPQSDAYSFEQSSKFFYWMPLDIIYVSQCNSMQPLAAYKLMRMGLYR